MSKKLRMLSLCAGIGGADLAAEATGAIEVVGQVEIDPFCQAVLAKHWPNVKRMSDITEVAGHEFGAIDIMVGGIPCQPHSIAGERKASKDERNLWPEFYRLIGTIKPRWIVAENVLGLLSSDGGHFFGNILRDLAQAGYDAEWCVLSAAQVGAPHKRERVFLVAYPINARRTNTWNISHPQISEWQEPGWEQNTDWIGRSSEGVANSNSQRREECDASTWSSESRLAARRDDTTTGSRQSQSRIRRIADGVSSWLHEHQWPARPNEAQKENEPARTITEKIAFRNQRLKALGNAIVPQQIFPLFDAIVAVEREMESVA